MNLNSTNYRFGEQILVGFFFLMFIFEGIDLQKPPTTLLLHRDLHNHMEWLFPALLGLSGT